MLSDFCLKRCATVLPPLETERFRQYVLGRLAKRLPIPTRGRAIDWALVAESCGIQVDQLLNAKEVIKPGLDAYAREMPNLPALKPKPVPKPKRIEKPRAPARPAKPLVSKPTKPPKPKLARVKKTRKKRIKRTGPPARPIVEFPPALFELDREPEAFHEALAIQMRRHRDSCRHIHRAVVKAKEPLDVRTISTWKSGQKVPRHVLSFEVLHRIERRYRLPRGYFEEKLSHRSRASTGHDVGGISPSEMRRLAWHLPNDFARRTAREQEEILSWVRTTVVCGSTEYRRYHAAALKHRYGIRFPSLQGSQVCEADSADDERIDAGPADDPELASIGTDAPPPLAEEMRDLIRFKTATLTTIGYQRIGVWGEETVSQKVEHLGLMFGALAAAPHSAVRGFGADKASLTFAMLIFPAVWDWYMTWRERRRGFYTAWEVDMLRVGLAFTRQDTGWLRQSPHLANRLREIPGLLGRADIERASQDWSGVCDAFHRYATARVAEIRRVVKVHRDPFEAILPVLEAPQPVAEYKRIADEILRLAPSESRYPRAAAESARSHLLIRLGLHLGLRQKNLRQLLYCPRGQAPLAERVLADRKCGELRWSEKDAGWEVFIPAVAFKNAGSSFFANKPYRLVLPDLANLYVCIEAYTDRHRKRLLGPAEDPGTFFVKTMKRSSADAAYDQTKFYEAWRLTIQRYGVYNPYTGRGAIRGLLPHGPHNVRDVLATHILKITGSYEQASYAIQDTPEMVARHYGRFLPQDKAALAAEVLNRVWRPEG